MSPESLNTHKITVTTAIMELPPSPKAKLGVVSGVYIPVVLNIISILMFLRFGSILGRIGLLGILGR